MVANQNARITSDFKMDTILNKQPPQGCILKDIGYQYFVTAELINCQVFLRKSVSLVTDDFSNSIVSKTSLDSPE